MTRSLTVAALAAALAAVAAPAAAPAATVTATSHYVEGYKGSGGDQVDVTITAAPGERNVIRLTRLQPAPGQSLLQVADTATPLTAGAGCTAAPAGVTCTTPAPAYSVGFSATVGLGDGDDALSVDPPTVPGFTTVGRLAVDGGPGDDALTAGGGAITVTLRGGPGADVLTGGPGDDLLDGGPGPDRITGGDQAVHDTVTYADRTAPVTATLGGGPVSGEAGEGDDIAADVETLRGGDGPDVLTGSDRDDTLFGGPGDDRLTGLGGDDVLVGGTGQNPPHYTFGATADALAGGPGHDRLATGPGGTADGGRGADELSVNGAGRLDGGPGADTLIAHAPGGATLLAGADGERDELHCATKAPPAAETLDARDVPLGCGPAPKRPRAGATALLDAFPGDASRLVAQLACPDDAPRGCVPTLTARNRSGRTVARGRYHLRPGHTRTVALRGRGRWARRGATVVLTLTARDATRAVRTERVTRCVRAGFSAPELRPGACPTG